MKMTSRTVLLSFWMMIVVSVMNADPLNCDLSGYKASPGLAANVAGETLVITWDGDGAAVLRLTLAIEGGTPIIRQLATRRKGEQWSTVATNVTPEFRVVSGLRRVTAQQLRPDSLAALGVTITPEILDAWNHQD